MLYKTNEESIVDLQDITASGFIFRKNLILAAIAGFVTLIELPHAGGMIAIKVYPNIIFALWLAIQDK